MNYLGYRFINMNIADRIKQRMRELDVTQDDLARQVQLTQPAIFKLLSGKTQRTTRLAEIAKALKVRPEWLASGEGLMTSENIQARYEEAPEAVRDAVKKLLCHKLDGADIDRAVSVINVLLSGSASHANAFQKDQRL